MADLPEGMFMAGDNARTNRAVNELAAEQYRLNSRLQRDVDRRQREHQTLSARVDRLEQMLLALIEHEDVREQMASMRAPADARAFARALLSAPADQPSVIAAPTDVPGYWLVPAARAVAEHGAAPAGTAALMAEAMRRDPDRAACFLTSAGALAGHHDLALSHLAAALPDGETASTEQRTIWMAAAAGRFGPAGLDALVTALMRALDAAGPSAEQRVDDLLDRVGSPQAASPQGVDAGRLDALASLAESARAGVPASADPSPGGAATPAAAGTSEPADDADPLAILASSLVEDGSPADADLVQRMHELRQALSSGHGSAPAAHDPDGVGDRVVWTLLLDDLFGAPKQATDPALRRAALGVLAPTILAAAERLAAGAHVEPPAKATVRAFDTDIRIDGSGPSSSDVLRATSASRSTQAGAGFAAGPAMVIVAGAVAAIGLLLTVTVSPGWLILTVLAIGGVIAAKVAALQAQRNAGAEATHRQHREQQRLDRAVSAHQTLLADASAAAGRADDALAAVRTIIASTSSGRAAAPGLTTTVIS